MGATVAETWQAHDSVMHARTEEWGTVGTAMAIRGVEASSSATYMQQVRMALRGCGTDEPLAVAIQRRFAELALRKWGYSAANNLVAGIRMLQKLKLIRATVTDVHRLQLRAIGKMAKAEDKPRVWATVADFQTLAERRVHWAWARVFFAVGMAFTICLRISDVAQIRWGWLAHKGCWCSSTTKWPRRCVPSPYHRFGNGGGIGSTRTGGLTSTTRTYIHPGRTRCPTEVTD